MADAEKIEISNLEELKAFRDAVNAGESYKGKTVVLTADIDLQGEEWTPIGNSTNQFQGNFDGQGHTVSNLKIDGAGKSNQGFFGFTTNGSVSNLTIKNATVTGRLNVGVVAGTPYTSKYTNIKVTGHVEVEGMAYVGGVGGKNAYADWTDITVDVDETSFVKADSVENGTAYRTYVGGVIGFMGEGGHTLKNITSNINVEGSTCDVGGIVGIAHYSNNFENVTCKAKEIVVNNDDAEVGAIAGVWHNASTYTVTMVNCTVSENTKVYKTVTDANGETVKKTVPAAEAVNGAAYTTDGSVSGKLLTATETTDAYGATTLKVTKVDGTGAQEKVSAADVQKVANLAKDANSFSVGSYDVAGYEGSNVVMDANGKIVGGSFTATESADSTAFSAALSENVQQQTDGSIANLSMISVDDNYAGLADGTVVADGIIIGVNAFASIQDAVKAAADGATIVVRGGTYGEYVTLSKEAVGSIKELNIIAAAGEKVNFTGTFQIGYRVDGTSSSPWSKHLTVDGFIFKPEIGEEKGSFVFQEVYGGLTVKNSVFSSIRDTDAYLLSCKTGQDHVVMDALFENCSFTGGRIQSASQAQDDLIFNNCTFTDVKINLQIGKGAIFNDSTFNYYFANGELTYIIRTNNDQAIEISGSTFNVDAAEDFVVEYKNGAPDFGMLWARQAGNASWVVEGCEVNYTAAALEIVSKEKDFAFIYNASTDKNKALERITVIDMTSENSAEELAAILGSSSGMVNVISDGKKTVYADGVALPMDKIVVDATKTAGEVFEVDGVSYMIGINAFTSLKDAADKAVDGVEIELLSNGKAAANFDGGGTVTLTGNADLDWSGANFMVGRGTNAQDTTVIIKDAAIGSTSEQASTGFHVSGAEKDSSSKANGTLIIDKSAVVTDYLINKNVVDVIGDGDYNDNEIDLTVKRGFGVAGRPSGETPSGTAHTAEMNITNGAYVKIGDENGMGIGHYDADEGKGVDGKGILNITDSKFESTQYLNVRTHGTVNVTNGELVVAGKITNDGVFYAENSRITAGTIVNSAENFSVVGGTLNAGLLTNNYYVFVNGDNKLDCNIDGVGYLLAGYYDANWEAATYNIVVENEISIIQEGVWFYKGGTFSIEENAKATITSTDTSNGYTRFLDRVNVDGELTVNNIVQMYDVDVNGTMTVNGGLHLIGYKQFEVNGTLNVVTDGGGNDGSLNAIYIGVEGAFDYINSNTVKMTVSGADAKVNITGKDGSKAENVVVCYNARVDQAASLEILDGAEFVTNGDVINQGTLTIDADSMLVAATLTMADGSTLTIDADGFVSGVRKIIDLSGTSSLENKITVSNAAEGVQVVYGADGDVTLVKKEVGALYVKDTYTSDAAVNAEVGGNLAYGVDAFSSVKSAFEKAIELGGGTINVLGTPAEIPMGTDINGASLIKMTGASGMDFVLTGTQAGNEFIAIEMRNAGTEAEEDFVLVDGKKATLLITDVNMAAYKLAAYTNSVITIENSVIDFRDNQSGPLYTKGNGEMYITNSAIKNLVQLSARGALMAVTDSLIDSGSGNTVYGGTMSLVGSTFNYSGVRIGDGGVLTIEDTKMVSNSVKSAKESANTGTIGWEEIALYVGYGNATNTTGTLNLKNAEFSIAKGKSTNSSTGAIADTTAGTVYVSESGTVNVEDSKFSADVVTNSGDFNVSGVSQLNIGTLTGKVELNGATLTDSVIGGGAGDVHAYGNVIVENGTFLNAEGSSRTGLTVMGGTTGLKGDVSTLVLGTDHARGTGVEKVLVISDGADVSVGLTGEDGSELKVGYLYARNDAEIIIEEGGKLNLNGQLSNRGTVTLKGKMEVAGVNGVGPIHLAGAGDPDEYGTMIIDGGELTDRKTSHQNANYLYTNTTMEIGHGGDQTSEVKVINGGKINTTNSYWNIYSDGVFKIQESSVSIVAPTNNPGYGLTWTPQEFVITNAGTIEISDASFAVDSLCNDGVVTLTNSTLTVDGNMKCSSSDGAVVLTNSTLTVNGSFTFKSSFDFGLMTLGGDTVTAGGINMDWRSSIVVGSWTPETWALAGVTVDVTGIESSGKTAFKVLDTLDGSYPNGIEVDKIIGTGAEEWHLEAVNGDVYLTSGDQSVLYVNSAYANDADGIVEDGKIVGYNAFGTAREAFAKAMTLGGGTINIIDSSSDSLTPFVKFTSAGTYTITGGNGATIPGIEDNAVAGVSVNVVNANIQLAKIRFGKNGEISTPAAEFSVTDSIVGLPGTDVAGQKGWWTFFNANLSVSGSYVGAMETLKGEGKYNFDVRSAQQVKAAGDSYKYLPYGSNYGAVHFGTAKNATIKDSTFIAGFFSASDRGTILVDNSMLYIGGGLLVNNKSNPDGVQNWTGASAADWNVGGVATVTIKDSIVRNIGWGDGGAGRGLRVGDTGYTGVLNLENSEVIFDDPAKVNDCENGWIFSGSELNINNSKFKIATLNNAGTITMDHKSTIAFGALTNSGTITIDTTGYTEGFYKVLDYTGIDSMDYSFVSGFGTNDKLVVIDNDLYVSNADQSVIYVDEKYQTNGEIVDGKLVGYNAFSQMVPQTWDDTVNFYDGVEKFVLTAGNTTSYGNLRIAETGNPTITIETVGTGAAVVNRLMVGGGSYPVNAILVAGSTIKAIGYDNSDGHSFTNPGSTFTIAGVAEINAAGSNCWRTYGTTGHTIVAETGKLIFNGGQVYNTGTMTVYGEMQINAEYWDAFAKLAGDETGNYASDFYIIGGSVNVDQRAFSIGGGWGSNWGEPHSGEANFSITDGGKFTSSAVVFRGGTSAVLTIDNSSMTFGNRADGSAWTGTGGGDYVSTYDGTINLTAGTLNLGVIDFVNNGTITMDHKSTIAFSTLTNSGTFTIDLSQYSDGAFKVLDSINNNYTVEMYQALLGNAYDNRFIVVGGDLFIADFADSEVYVNNNSYSGNVGDVTADGKIIGVNAFATVDDAVAAGAQSVTVSGGEYGKTGFDGVKATIGNVTYSGAVYGGNCDENAVVSETIDLTISGGELQSAVYGGSRVHGGTSCTSGCIAVAGDVNVKVTSGSVQNVFVGGDLVTQALMFVREGDINVNIFGGEFNDRVYGGITVHATANASCMAQLAGNINMTISGGDFNDRVYGGNLAGKYERGDKLTITGNISVALDVSSNSVSFAEHLVLGSSGTSAVHGNTKLTLTGLGSNLTFADNSVIVGGSGDSYYLVEGGNRTPVSFVEGTKEFAFNAFTGDLNAQIKIFDTMSFAGNSEVNFADSAINLDEISNWNFESGSLITGAANAISFNGDTINLNGSWEAGAAFELGNIDAFGDYTAWNDVTVYYGGSAVNYQFEEKENKLVITKLA